MNSYNLADSFYQPVIYKPLSASRTKNVMYKTSLGFNTKSVYEGKNIKYVAILLKIRRKPT